MYDIPNYAPLLPLGGAEEPAFSLILTMVRDTVDTPIQERPVTTRNNRS